mmetsp:Transcript_37691/g.88166  ORF Transcript_37691/g.88166 Transcript_37691/m.88166 type:complete len:391 (-) Transcript_37691:207-1379(-)
MLRARSMRTTLGACVCLTVVAIRSPAGGNIDRRRLMTSIAAAGLTPRLPTLAADNLERIIPQEVLTGALTAAAPREIIITGSNSGVGLAGARLLTAAGHHVLCACRTKAKADAAAADCTTYAHANRLRAGGTARGEACDLASLASVRSFASSVKGVKVDTLVLNAGIARGTSESDPRRTADGFEETIGVNHLGHFLLASLLVPTLKASPAARVVVTASPVHDPTSGGGNVGSTATLGDLSGLRGGAGFTMVDGGLFDPDKAYKDSKLCNMMFMLEASRRLASEGITVNAFSPGLIADPNGFFRNQNQIFANVFNSITKLVGVAESNEFGGSALAYMAVDPALDGLTGGWYDTLPPGKHQLTVHAASDEARQMDKQNQLWTLSSRLVGVPS